MAEGIGETSSPWWGALHGGPRSELRVSQGRAWGRPGPRGTLQGQQQEARGASWHLIRAPEPQAGSWAVPLRDVGGWPRPSHLLRAEGGPALRRIRLLTSIMIPRLGVLR